ncbi:MAG: capsular biosynthesis protein [Burkholderiaceae bacterium]
MTLVTALTPWRLKLLVVALPLLLASGYYLFLAGDRFVSTAIITVRQADHGGAGVPGMALVLAGVNPPAREDTLYLRQYIHSLELLQRLDRELALRKHYESNQSDLLFRLFPGTSQEWLHEYYRSRVEVLFDDTASLLTVRTQGFDPAFAQHLNQAILRDSERFVNEFSQRMAREQLRFAETELKLTAARLQAAQGKVLAFQSAHKLLDPLAQAQAAGTLSTEMQANLAKQEAELKNALSFLHDESYQVKALRSQIDAQRSQLDAERTRATAGKVGERLNTLAADFQALTLQTRFAEDAYKLALAAVENARIDATRKLKSLVVIEPPTLPQSAEYPRRIYNLVTLALVCGLIYAVARLVVATVREHHD